MTITQKEKLGFVFNKLKDDQKELDILSLPYIEFKDILNDKEIIALEISNEIKNRSMFTGYSGIINLVRVSKGEVILKPTLIKKLIS